MSFAPYSLVTGIRAALDRDIQDAKDKLGKGHWHGEPEGKRLCGRIDGLEQAKTRLAEEYGKLETLEEDEE